MSGEQALLWTIGGSLIAYTLTAGADFGGGVWDLFASKSTKARQRKLIADAIAPIWEANHIWMIVAIVLLFSAFPHAFATLSIALHIPISLALVGIVLRGAAFTFRAYGLSGSGLRETWGRVFAWSSLLTPPFLGMTLAGISSGDIELAGHQVVSGFFAGWTTVFALLLGCFVTALFSLLAAVYLTRDAERNAPDLANAFRVRALRCEVICGGLAALVALSASADAPQLFANLVGSPWSLSVQVLTALAAGCACWGLWRRHYRLARGAVMAQVSLVTLGWGLAMDGHLILDAVPASAGGLHEELAAPLLWALTGGGVLLGPALWWLFRVFKTRVAH